MRRLLCALLIWASPAAAEGPDIEAIVQGHILPNYTELAEQSATLAAQAAENCAPDNPALIAAYHDAFDAWIAVSHLRFGPSEQDDRAFALAFWPDPRGSTPKTLATLIRDADPVVESVTEYSTVSVAARGFYALEFLLYDDRFRTPDHTEYTCALRRVLTADIAANTAAILNDWQDGYAALMSTHQNDVYRSRDEAARQLFTALSTGLEFTSQTRLGRPLGTPDRPRAKRAEARRSGRALRHVVLSLTATKELAAMIAPDHGYLVTAFDTAIRPAEKLDDPTLAGVADPKARFRIESLQSRIEVIRDILSQEVGPALGIVAGFNALDGD